MERHIKIRQIKIDNQLLIKHFKAYFKLKKAYLNSTIQAPMCTHKIVERTSIIDTLELIKKRPGMFFTAPTITALQGFWAGYMYGAGTDINYTDFQIFEGFQLFICNKYNYTVTDARHLIPFDCILLQNNRITPEEAYDLFFAELETYYNTQGIVR